MPMVARCHQEAGQLRLWTIQRREAWESLRTRGMLRADGRRVYRESRSAYRWLMRQMHARLASYSGGYPLWAWYCPKPDLRNGGHLPSRSHGVRIEFCVPASRVLLLDFDAWHFVLNHAYLSLTEAEERAWERRVPKHNGHEALSPDRQHDMERSWERVFDLAALNTSSWVGPVRSVQAVVEEIRRDEVTCVTAFVAR